jgi:hypothetical protein
VEQAIQQEKEELEKRKADKKEAKRLKKEQKETEMKQFMDEDVHKVMGFGTFK